jgi:hypothetical protein
VCSPVAAPQKLYIVLQYIEGGELYEYAVTKYVIPLAHVTTPTHLLS